MSKSYAFSGKRIADRFELMFPIATQADRAYSSVWAARDTARSVEIRAIVIDPEFPGANAVLDAARRTSYLQNTEDIAAAMVTTIAVIGQGGDYAIFTEIPPGRRLSDFLNDKPLPPQLAHAIIGEVTSAINSVRHQGIRHLVLDTDDIYITDAGNVIIDGYGVNAALHSIPHDLDTAELDRREAEGIIAVLASLLVGRHVSRETFIEQRNEIIQEAANMPDLSAEIKELLTATTTDHGPSSPNNLLLELVPWADVDTDSLSTFAPTIPEVTGEHIDTAESSIDFARASAGLAGASAGLAGTSAGLASDSESLADSAIDFSSTVFPKVFDDDAAGGEDASNEDSADSGEIDSESLTDEKDVDPDSVHDESGVAEDIGEAEAEPGSEAEAEPGSEAEAEPGSEAEAEPGSDAEVEVGSDAEVENPSDISSESDDSAVEPDEMTSGESAEASYEPTEADDETDSPDVEPTEVTGEVAEVVSNNPAQTPEEAEEKVETLLGITAESTVPDVNQWPAVADSTVADTEADNENETAGDSDLVGDNTQILASIHPQLESDLEADHVTTNVHVLNAEDISATGHLAGENLAVSNLDSHQPRSPRQASSSKKVPTPSSGRSFNASTLVIIILVLIVVFAAVLGLRQLFKPLRDVEITTPDSHETTSQQAQNPAVPPKVVAANLVDPDSPRFFSDPEVPNYPENVGHIIDGNPETIWQSWYFNDPGMGDISGIGIHVVLEQEAQLSTLILDVAGSGGNVQVKTGGDPNGGELLYEGPVDEKTTITFEQKPLTSDLLLWFTELPVDHTGANRIYLSDISVE